MSKQTYDSHLTSTPMSKKVKFNTCPKDISTIFELDKNGTLHGSKYLSKCSSMILLKSIDYFLQLQNDIGYFGLASIYYYKQKYQQIIDICQMYPNIASLQNIHGDIYYYGHIEGQRSQGFKYYMLSCEQGYAEGQYNAGFCLKHGKGTNKDEEKGIYYNYLAVKQNNKHAIEASSFIRKNI